MSSTTQKPSKRPDLQGIRGIAIIAVLIFHFFPDQFPNGYLGVDQFFVLSGFLMCMLLKRKERNAPHLLIFTFYLKRFKRILPLYFLIIFLSMVSLYNIFPDTALELNKASASKALLFISNRPKAEAEGYFEMIFSSTDIFSHTWSLSVEIQFYFLIPFMFLIANSLTNKLQYVFYAILGASSFIFHSRSPDSIAFNSVFARIWQFLIGMVVYLLTDSQRKDYLPLKDNYKDKEPLLENKELLRKTIATEAIWHIIKYFIIMSFIIIVFCQITFPALIVRFLTTLLTGLIFFISENDPILSNKVLTYIGDISYSLYLIHWPICAYCRLIYGNNFCYLIIGMLLSVILAILTFETFEKWYLHLPPLQNGILVAVMFFVSLLTINQSDIVDYLLPNTIGINTTRLDRITNDLTIEDAGRFNRRWNSKEYHNLLSPTCVYEQNDTPFGWCRHQGLSQYSKYKMAIFGNSWTANHATLFYQECGNKAKSILQGSITSCEPLYPTQHIQSCKDSFNEFLERIKIEKPDFGFIMSRFISVGSPRTVEEVSLGIDPIYNVMKAQTLKLLKYIGKKLYILNAIPNPATRNIQLIVKFLKQGMDLREIDKLVVDMNSYKIARERYFRLAMDCGEKCELIDYEPLFFNNTTETFRYYDEKGFAFMTRGLHISPRGLEHVRPIWHEICKHL